MNQTKLAICIPNTGSINTKTVFSLIKLLKRLTFPYQVFFKESCYIHMNREQLVDTVLKLDFTHILFIDADMVFEPEGLFTLLSRDKDIVGVHYNMRKIPLTSTVNLTQEKKDEIARERPEITKVDGLATGFLLIKTDVFRNLSKPWFFFEYIDENDFWGEDFWFCRKAKETGYDIWLDLTVQVKHCGYYLY